MALPALLIARQSSHLFILPRKPVLHRKIFTPNAADLGEFEDRFQPLLTIQDVIRARIVEIEEIEGTGYAVQDRLI